MYLLSSNIGEIIIMTVATLFGWPLPLTAVQLLYLNLATDGFPALALAVDPPEHDLMKQKPRNPNTGIFTRTTITLMLISSVWLAILIIAAYRWSLYTAKNLLAQRSDPLGAAAPDCARLRPHLPARVWHLRSPTP